MKLLFVLSVMFAAVCALPGAAFAATAERCVNTNGELANAIALAETEPVTIKVAQGSYAIDSTDWGTAPFPTFVQGGTSVRGGYSADCSSRNIAADNTVLTNNHSYLVQVIATGDLTLEGITWSSGGQIVEFDLNNQYVHYAADPQILVHRCVFINVPLTFQWTTDRSIGGSLRIDDTLIYGLNWIAAEPTLAIYVDQGAPDVELVNDTVVDALNGGGAALGNHVDGSNGAATFYVYNSIFYGNSGTDLDADNSKLVLVDNIIGTHSYPTPDTTPVGTLHVDPALDSNYRPIESPASPAINSGTSNVPDGLPSKDLIGNSRTIGSEPDRGAYESHVDDSTIQIVTNTNNSGTGSLRQAIINANATAGFVVIEFAITASCPQTISLSSTLDDITGDVWIDGFTQSGSALNDLDFGEDATLCIILDGSAHSIANGLHVANTAPATATLIANGLAFSGFTSAGIRLEGGGTDHFIGGDQFGGLVGFEFLGQNTNDIVIGPGVSGVLIGGSDPGNRNVIQLATNDGIALDDTSHDIQIVNNFVGVGWNSVSGTNTNAGNANKGILINGYNNTISGNIISYNGDDGIDIDAGYGNQIEYNYIGTSINFDNLGNGNMGVRVENDGHDNSIHDNTIAFNQQKGVRIVTGLHNTISHNDIEQNALLGIDLAGEGVTANDDDSNPPTSDYANRGQNFPTISSAIGGHYSGQALMTFTSTPGDYTVEFFGNESCDASGYGEGANYLGSQVVTIPGGFATGSVSWYYTLTSPRPFYLPPFISATATDADGNTSEFSNCFPYTDDTIFADDFEPLFLF